MRTTNIDHVLKNTRIDSNQDSLMQVISVGLLSHSPVLSLLGYCHLQAYIHQYPISIKNYDKKKLHVLHPAILVCVCVCVLGAWCGINKASRLVCAVILVWD